MKSSPLCAQHARCYQHLASRHAHLPRRQIVDAPTSQTSPCHRPTGLQPYLQKWLPPLREGRSPSVVVSTLDDISGGPPYLGEPKVKSHQKYEVAGDEDSEVTPAYRLNGERRDLHKHHYQSGLAREANCHAGCTNFHRLDSVRLLSQMAMYIP
jgi:hypothetical protein